MYDDSNTRRLSTDSSVLNFLRVRVIVESGMLLKTKAKTKARTKVANTKEVSAVAIYDGR
jgi:hypothetical protein